VIFGIIILEQVEAVIKSVLTTYHDHISSWGLCIILLTFTVRLVILPLTIKQFRSMAAMQGIQPKVKQIQNKYKGKSSRDDRQAMQAEMMALYKEHGVNPFASCLPLVAQLPVFIGLYQVLRNQIEPTPVYSFLGIDNIFEKLSEIGGVTEYIIIGLYVATMLGSTLLFSFVTDRQQKYMFAAMPIFFIPFVIGVPAGVMIYWITTNVWTICQQGVIKRTMGHRLRPAAAGGSGGGGSGGGATAKAATGKAATGSRTPPSSTGRRAQGNTRGKRRRGGGGRRR
jgi:YidC/Oxa1 family membrane protein insertase